MKLSDGVAEWLEHRAVNAGMSAGTLKADRESLARFQSVVGDIYIHNVDGRHITKALLELGYAGPKASIGPGARNNFTGKLNVFFNYALNVRWTKQNPMALVPNVKNPPEAVAAVPREQVRCPARQRSRPQGSWCARHSPVPVPAAR